MLLIIETDKIKRESKTYFIESSSEHVLANPIFNRKISLNIVNMSFLKDFLYRETNSSDTKTENTSGSE